MPVIYTRADFWRTVGNPAGFSNYKLWVAHYTKKPRPVLPHGWSDYAFWQYTDSGMALGVHGACDMNRFNGDNSALQKLLVPASPAAMVRRRGAGIGSTPNQLHFSLLGSMRSIGCRDCPGSRVTRSLSFKCPTRIRYSE